VISVGLIAVLGLAVLAWVAVPLRRGPQVDEPLPSLQLEEANAKKRAALVAILDLEAEQASGKLSSGDFAVLRSEYETKALLALREADALRDSTFDDDELEREIAAIRERLRCPNCGAARRPGEPCKRCGS
jgi:hypothetical protein